MLLRKISFKNENISKILSKEYSLRTTVVKIISVGCGTLSLPLSTLSSSFFMKTIKAVAMGDWGGASTVE